jgi:subtilisin family serine protease
VDVVNGSIGGVGYDAFLYTPLAQARLALGTMFIGAIGNSGQYGINHHGSPANYDISVGVGAVDQEMRVAAFSDWGTVPEHPGVAKPDLCAPGCAVWSAVPGGGYEEMDGTSMATPLVTGAAALLLERDPALSLSVAALQSQLFALTSTPPSGPRAGRGRLDLSGI